jgi:ketosteroid isomerase-like protein
MGSAALKSQASRDEADIRALIKTIDKAHRDKDAAAIVAPYAQDAVVCDLAPPLSHRGMDLQVKQAWLDSHIPQIPSATKVLAISDMQEGNWSLG